MEYIFFSDNKSEIISIGIGIMGIILAILFYLKSIRAKKPTYSLQTFSLVDNWLSQIESLEIKYNGTLVHNLSLTRIYFWNNGSLPITKNDFAENDRLRVRMVDKNDKIYGFQMIHAKKHNSVIPNIDDQNVLYINFDFLNKHDGTILSIYHSGKKSNDLIVEGTFIGADEIKEYNNLPIVFSLLTKPLDYLQERYNKINNSLRWILSPLWFIVLLLIMIPVVIIGMLNFIIEYVFITRPPKRFRV